MGCYGDTGCYYDDDLVPTAFPTTIPPTNPRNNPESTYFCGMTWSEASATCSVETHCSSNSDCKPNETCYHDVPGCNVEDLRDKQDPNDPASNSNNNNNNNNNNDGQPAKKPSNNNYPVVALDKQDPSNNRFCGENWSAAENYCSLETHCMDGMDDSCPPGMYCFSYISSCNAYDMLGLITRTPTWEPTTNKPTEPPTKDPTKEPTNTPTAKEPTTLEPTFKVNI